MSSYIIQGGKKLSGSIHVAGNKNAVLPIMASTLLVDGETTLTNVPDISDVAVMLEILEHLGARVNRSERHTVTIDTGKVTGFSIPLELAEKLRASVLFLGPLYARFGRVELPHPGGDVIGKRSIDTHLTAMKALGASCKISDDTYILSREESPSSVSIFLDEPSVTGTENLIMASIGEGKTVTIHNAATEPHVFDLCTFLQKAGASVEGAGGHSITVRGKIPLQAVNHTVIPDYIEMGTFAVMAAATAGNIEITGGNPDDLTAPLRVLSAMGVDLQAKDHSLQVKRSGLFSPEKRVQAMPHPGFPTDLMSPFIVLATQARGETLFHDPLYESRMFFVDKLIRMGAQITICDPHRVLVNGPTVLTGRHLASPDIRAGMALVLAAMIGEGESTIDNAEMIERGYERIDERLRQLGAEITRSE
ncbi:MAG TPA: UDP-N-acetylglucosamine 1-carboxyvinyltransferase [Patescibacteria group bacterium]|nr:UDP-N-acetylglucosamine 1-carboxyvinyltransferase [Patescibacteria group bacterium]